MHQILHSLLVSGLAGQQSKTKESRNVIPGQPTPWIQWPFSSVSLSVPGNSRLQLNHVVPGWTDGEIQHG